MRLSANHRVERNRILLLWLEVLHIDLSCDSLIAIENGGGAFAHLNGLHPWTRDIFHTKRLCQSADIGCVLCEELHIGAAQAEQTNLFCTCSGIGVCHIHRGTRFKTLREVAAGSHTECFTRQGLCS